MRSALLALLAACGDNLHGQAIDATPDVPPGTPITVTMGHPADTAKYMFIAAFQDGDGPWQPAPAPNGDDYTFYVQSDRWGFASTWRDPDPSSGQLRSFVQTYFFTVAERTRLGLECASSAPSTTATVSGTVTGLPATSSANEYLASYEWSAASLSKSQTTATFTITGVDPGPHDLMVVHWLPGAGADGIAILHDVVAPASNVPMDWTTAGISTANISVTDQNATDIQFASEVVTSVSDGVVDLGYCTSSPCNSTIAGLTAALATPKDASHQWVDAYNSASGWRFERWVSTMSDLVLTAPAPLTNVSSTVDSATMPYPRIATTWDSYPGAAAYSWRVENYDREWSAWISPGYAAASPSFEMPDLSQISGWSTNAFGLWPSNFVSVGVDALTVSGNVTIDDVISFAYWPYRSPPAQLASVSATASVKLPP